MFSIRLTAVALLPVLSLHSASAANLLRRSPSKGQNAIVQLFEWPWDSVASECTTFLGPAGFGYVQVSPANEHITGGQWWTDYQPVSYNLTSKRGSRAQFASMVSKCNAAGVGVIVDVVLNHMTAGSGVGIGGSTYTKYNYPAVPYTPSNFHYCNGNSAAQISNYGDAYNVRFCELVGLSDLAQEQEAVRKIMAAFLNDLLSLGVAGFRIDAAKHMDPTQINNILGLLTAPFYNTKEVIYGANEAVQPSQYVGSPGDIMEFRATSSLQTYFSSGIAALLIPSPMGAAWGFVDSGIANFIMANQDTERGGTSLTSKAANNAYQLSGIFILGFNYGTPTVFSGYDYSSSDQGAPQDARGLTNAVTCNSNGWRCEHRWNGIANMVAFHNAVGGAALTNIVAGTSQQVAFGRGAAGFLIINNAASAWTKIWTTSLPAGTYCDIIHSNNTYPTTCNGPLYVVSATGMLTASVARYDALAIFTGAASPGTAPNTSASANSTSLLSSNLLASSSQTSSGLPSSSSASSSLPSVTIATAVTSTTSSPTPVSTAVTITFMQTASTASGEVLKVVGSISQLGSWAPAAALPLAPPSTGNAPWTLTVTLPPGTSFAYKFIKVASSGSVTWESGNDRVYMTPGAGTSVTLYGTFGLTGSSTSAVTGAGPATTAASSSSSSAASSPAASSSPVSPPASSSRAYTSPLASSPASTQAASSSLASSPASTQATVTFKESASTTSGEAIKLVGSISQLGNWAPASAVTLTNANSVWSVTLALPPNTAFQYKFTRVKSGTVSWESDPNRLYTTLGQGSSVTLTSTFR
ncbi:glycoside hydrolase superfamily [Mycena albidolilacea]|uniref:Alpha-amylase n=1 Tax=Mycena albidolilacea TaxID=1033008 RepID=A0AAD7EST1_9AGAR|nr:glycoside hydrolase superfamily [Mycena albidolilacea]